MSTAPVHRFVVVEGPIGVGKTNLARRLAQSFGSELILEQTEENPFLERFYRNPRTAAFPTQLFFLFQRARQLQEFGNKTCSTRCVWRTTCSTRIACLPALRWMTRNSRFMSRYTPSSRSMRRSRTW